MELHRALFLARVCSAVYDETALRELAQSCGAGLQTFAHAGRITAAILSDDRDIVLAFRGSMDPRIPGEDDATRIDWQANFDYHLVERAGFPGRIVSGFEMRLESYTAVAEIRAAIDDHGPRTKHVYLTGHSLGGALAILEGHRLSQSGVRIHGIYTFGAPRPGDAGFATGFRLPLYRFENNHDPVPWLPMSFHERMSLAVTAYQHPGELYYFDRGSLRWPEENLPRLNALARLATRVRDRSFGLEDHWLEAYIAAIETNLPPDPATTREGPVTIENRTGQTVTFWLRHYYDRTGHRHPGQSDSWNLTPGQLLQPLRDRQPIVAARIHFALTVGWALYNVAGYVASSFDDRGNLLVPIEESHLPR